MGHFRTALRAERRLNLPGGTVFPKGTVFLTVRAAQHKQHFLGIVIFRVFTAMHQALVDNPQSLFAAVLTVRLFSQSGGGNWYKGNHEPLVTKEPFDKVQQALVVPIKSKWGSKEFPYKQFLKCYSCGASVVGEEKIRNYKYGNTRRFVYYHCSRQVDNNCREPFVREADIVSELILMCDELITDTTKLEPGLRDAIDKFTKMMLVTHKTFGKKNMIGGYVKYVLAEGSQFE